MKRVSYNGILLMLFSFSLALAVGQLHAQAPKILYLYDDLGRLLQVIDQNNECATYTYDAVGNILKITRSTSCLQAPTIANVSQDTALVGDTTCITIATLVTFDGTTAISLPFPDFNVNLDHFFGSHIPASQS